MDGYNLLYALRAMYLADQRRKRMVRHLRIRSAREKSVGIDFQARPTGMSSKTKTLETEGKRGHYQT